MNQSQPVTYIEEYRPPAQVAAWTPNFISSVAEMKMRVQAKRSFYRDVMEEGKHYGKIPGVDKDVLFKPGAELLLSSMGLFADLVDAQVVQDYDGAQHNGEPLIAYRRAALIYRQTGPTEHERVRVARAEGFCSSREKKYRYRDSKPECPLCGKQAIFASKNDIGAFFCWKKEGGCGVNFDAGDERITKQPKGKVWNPEIYDLENTILKMADKRAYVAATLLATGCSDIFTQDVEDDPPFHGETKDAPPRNNNRNDAPPQSSEPIGDGLIQSIKSMWGHLSQQEQWAMVIKATGGKARDIERATSEQGAAIYNELRKIAPQTQTNEAPADQAKPTTPSDYVANVIAKHAIPEETVSSLWSDLIGDARGNYPTWERGEVDMLRDFAKALNAWAKAQREKQAEPETQAEPTPEPGQAVEQKAETPEDALDKELDTFASPKVTEQAVRSTIDPQIIEEFRGMRQPHTIKLLCVTAESVGLTGAALRDIVKKATNGEVLTQVTYDHVMSTLQKLPKKA